MSIIEVKNITKNYRVYEKKDGFFNTAKSIFYREYKNKCAVENISFNIEKGQLVGYIGPNGAGKSTTIKMLSGILVPTSGEVVVNNYIPYKQRKENALRIGVVFGQRSQLFWDLPILDTFELYQMMYKIDNNRYKRNVSFFIELLEMQEFIKRPVRQLSLGQKMRANIAISMLHDPEILYLDEPTIGLDVVAKDKIRCFIREINGEKKTTVILTTHDMDDIESICNRLIMIDKGKLLYDGELGQFKRKFAGDTIVIVECVDNTPFELFDSRLKLIKAEGRKKWIAYRKEEISTANAIKILTQANEVTDISIKEADIEDVVREIYKNGLREI